MKRAFSSLAALFMLGAFPTSSRGAGPEQIGQALQAALSKCAVK